MALLHQHSTTVRVHPIDNSSMSSIWQQRYSSTNRKEDASISNWIEEVQRLADDDADNDTYDVSGIPSDNDVADVIRRMENLLNSTHDLSVSFNFDDYNFDDNLDDDSMLQQPSLDDQIVESIRIQSTDKLKKKIFDELRKYCKSEKKRLGWVSKLISKQQRMKLQSKHFLTWKSINRMVRMKETMLACKVGRATSTKFRRAFKDWKRIMLMRREQLSRVDYRLRRRIYRRTFSVLMQNKESNRIQMERAREIFERRRKVEVLSSWRTVVSRHRKLVQRAERHRVARVLRQCFIAWISFRKVRKSACHGGKENCINAKHGMPNNEDDVLLIPLRESRRRVPRGNSTPESITNMHRRNEERLQRKEILRSRKDKIANERNKSLRKERLSREQRELRIHTEYMQKKKMEKEQKELEIRRRKEANRLAVLHYKFSLQKRYLLQWKRIFGIIGWNQRKADLFFRDSTYEITFFSWYRFSKNRALRLEKRHHLAVEYYETSLLANAFASLEENVSHSHHLYNNAVCRISLFRKRIVLKKWHNKVMLLVKERVALEAKAILLHRIFILRRALNAWKLCVKISREDKRVEKLVDEKYVAMMQWLEASRKDDWPYEASSSM